MSKPFPLRATARCVALGLLLSASVAQAGILDSFTHLFDDNSDSETTSAAARRTTEWLEHPDHKLKWNDWDYVQLVARESSATPNQHPAVIPTERVAMALARVRAMDGRAITPMFTKNEIYHLAPAIAGVLAKATPDQEMIFESTGAHEQIGPLSKKKTNTGRVFVHDGKLNIIVGTALRPETGNYQVQSLANLPVGARAAAANDVQLAQPTAEEGVLQRSDWIALSLDAPAPVVVVQPTPAYVAPSNAVNVATPANAAFVAPPANPAYVAPQAARVAAPQVAQPARPVAPTAAVAPARPAVLPAPVDATEDDRMTRLETRLRFLSRLHEQGLLTDEEFKQKRADVVKQM